jgi:ATP-dependent exoDNAse (exonuclease V) beta subunit
LNENSQNVPTYVHEKHYILSSELKHLYVAITRARQRLWICDENEQALLPMSQYWEHHKLVSRTQNMADDLRILACQSDEDEWNRKGRMFFEQEKFAQVKRFV